MAIAEHIETLRAKPEHVRRRIAFWTSFSVTALIFMFWIGSFTSPGAATSAKLAAAPQSGMTASAASAVSAVPAPKASSPGRSIIAGVGAFGKDVWSLIFGTKKVIYSEVEVTPGSN